jgi:hypothetical protein
MSSNNLCLHSRFGMMFLFLDQVFGETLNTPPSPSPNIELCLAHVSLVFLHMSCWPAWFSSMESGGAVFSVWCLEENSIYDHGVYWCVSSLEITIITRLVGVGRLCFEPGRLHCEFSQPGEKKKEGMKGAKGTFLGRLGPSHHLRGEKTKSPKY